MTYLVRFGSFIELVLSVDIVLIQCQLDVTQFLGSALGPEVHQKQPQPLRELGPAGRVGRLPRKDVETWESRDKAKILLSTSWPLQLWASYSQPLSARLSNGGRIAGKSHFLRLAWVD